VFDEEGRKSRVRVLLMMQWYILKFFLSVLLSEIYKNLAFANLEPAPHH
jgi:hypothetical protein